MKVEITNAAPTAPAEVAPSAPATEAAERERLSAGSVSTAAVQTPDVTYPPLTQHMNVQGSVVLQALIGVDGIIENLRVVSGPAILATAAQQAVREWRFKPIYQNGQAVETKAKITVNFTIKVADGSEKTTLAESRNDSLLILTR
jgi:protein TonB